LSHKKKEVGVAETEKPEREEAATDRIGKDVPQRRDMTGRRGCLRIVIIENDLATWMMHAKKNIKRENSRILNFHCDSTGLESLSKKT